MKIERDNGHQAKHTEIAENLVQKTRLSFREAEVYALTQIGGLTHREAAEEMNISRGNIAGKKGSIKNKIQEAQRTAKLDL